MKKIYYLKTCNTCQKILKALDAANDFQLQNIKEQPISITDLEILKSLSGSYEALFSKRAKLYKEMDLKNEDLKEMDFRQFILDHYTFLKRPVIVIDNKIYIGNSQKTLAAAKLALSNA